MRCLFRSIELRSTRWLPTGGMRRAVSVRMAMPNTEGLRTRFRVERSIEVDAAIGRVFSRWSRYEDFPRFMESVRRTKRIDDRRMLWDVDILGRQFVWEALVVENNPEKSICWNSTWGVSNRGEVRFESLSDDRTRITIEIEYRPRGFLECLGARSGLVDLHVSRDLAHFRSVIEKQNANGVAAADALRA